MPDGHREGRRFRPQAICVTLDKYRAHIKMCTHRMFLLQKLLQMLKRLFDCQYDSLKEVCHTSFDLYFFMIRTYPSPLIDRLRYVRIRFRFRFRREIRS